VAQWNCCVSSNTDDTDTLPQGCRLQHLLLQLSLHLLSVQVICYPPPQHCPSPFSFQHSSCLLQCFTFPFYLYFSTSSFLLILQLFYSFSLYFTFCLLLSFLLVFILLQLLLSLILSLLLSVLFLLSHSLLIPLIPYHFLLPMPPPPNAMLCVHSKHSDHIGSVRLSKLLFVFTLIRVNFCFEHYLTML
jgi:hypothetical protein